MQLKTKNATLQPIATRIKNCVLIQRKRGEMTAPLFSFGSGSQTRVRYREPNLVSPAANVPLRPKGKKGTHTSNSSAILTCG